MWHRICRLIVLTTLILGSNYSANALAWSDHASLLWPLVRAQPQLLEPSLRATPLASFIAADSEGLASLLEEHEQWSRAQLPHYAPRPDELAFRPNTANPVASFLQAVRVNPTLSYGLFRQLTVEDTPVPALNQQKFSDLSFLSGGTATASVIYETLEPGDWVAPAHVVATGSDEPDLGMDIGLFEDNGTPFGARFGFGKQPFGNPNLDYSSQAPFHMGFYHLDWLTRTAQPDLLRTFPEWRVSLFQALAIHAFRTGQDYWGWRFMGWALHYIGDLTQPYHAEPLPGISTPEALWTLIKGETGAAIQLVSNRHGVLESYQYQRVTALQSAADWDHPLLRAIASGAPIRSFEASTLRESLTRDSIAAGADLDAALEAHMPWIYVSDPGFEWTGSGHEADIVQRVTRESGPAAIDALDTSVAEQMARFSRYAGGWLALAQQYWQAE